MPAEEKLKMLLAICSANYDSRGRELELSTGSNESVIAIERISAQRIVYSFLIELIKDESLLAYIYYSVI